MANVIIQQPPTVSTLAVQSNQWHTGICDCFDDCDVCCFAFWCFPFFACRTASDFGECFCLPLVDNTLCYGVSLPPISLAMRAAVRNRYGIEGSLMSDCMYTAFCNTCSWCQMAREIKRRKATITVINSQSTVISAPPVVVSPPPPVIVPQPTVIAPPTPVVVPQPTVFAPQPTVVTSTQSAIVATQIR
ncbi:placenta-specific gene 8 protein-like [Chanos chanos]|uniref:Placenta-specific gene 8 protein-like n=1 Tax=Chanos chanos TaxID=29144 RepID=A0A6J2VQ80_CHACN|nr:placenta-specific gene 8 protein-like [Chanos chanos]